MNPSLKNALVTGAGRGIGFEFVEQLYAVRASSGAPEFRIAAVVRRLEKYPKLRQFAERSEGRVTVFEADVSSKSAVAALASRWEGSSLDVLINNAGVYLDGELDFDALTPEILEGSFRTNSIGPIWVTQAFLPKLQKAEAPIVANISSLMGSVGDNGSGGAYAYRMSKAALNMFTRSFARDYPKIKALALHPGWVQTDMGGENATTSTRESVEGLLKAILNAKASDSGEFLDFEGDRCPW